MQRQLDAAFCFSELRLLNLLCPFRHFLQLDSLELRLPSGFRIVKADGYAIGLHQFLLAPILPPGIVQNNPPFVDTPASEFYLVIKQIVYAGEILSPTSLRLLPPPRGLYPNKQRSRLLGGCPLRVLVFSRPHRE
jgi:hypothetical protein